MAKWTKPSGLEVETNDEPATIAHCESIGWKRTDEAQSDEAPAEAEPVAVETEAEAVEDEAVETETETEHDPEPQPATLGGPTGEPQAETRGRRRPAG